MTYLFAPLEGLTGYIYRNTHAAYFSPADEYFTPFLSPNQNRRFTSREKNDVLPEHNEGLHVVPQLLTNQSEHFLWAAGELAAMGYDEVNLNLGCPSGTVVAKKKGSGFLTELEALDRFLDEVCTKAPCAVSVKTRLGRYSPDEFPALLEIFNRYPLKRLIIHPRVQTDFLPELCQFGRLRRSAWQIAGIRSASMATCSPPPMWIRFVPVFRRCKV